MPPSGKNAKKNAKKRAKAKQQTSRPLENEVVERRQLRAERSTKKAEELEKLKNQGNELFRKSDFQGAAEIYLSAVERYGSKIQILSNLAVALVKLELWEEAEEVATEALKVDPKHVKARWQRAVARKRQEKYSPAMLDFGEIMRNQEDPYSRIAMDAMAEHNAVEELWWKSGQASKDMDDPNEYEIDELMCWPAFDDDPEIYTSDSDTSDCRHTGCGIPCRYYNHGGCTRGTECTYSHASDLKSVRDELGKNVCLYYLASRCRFGEDCQYSHDRQYLPARGWWTNRRLLQNKVQELMMEKFINSAQFQRRWLANIKSALSSLKRSCQTTPATPAQIQMLTDFSMEGPKLSEEEAAMKELYTASFLHFAEEYFADTPGKFKQLQDHISDLKQSKIDTLTFVERMSDLCYATNDMAEGINLFMPYGWSVKRSADPAFPGGWKIEITHAAGLYTRRYNSASSFKGTAWEFKDFTTDDGLTAAMNVMSDIRERYKTRPEVCEQLAQLARAPAQYAGPPLNRAEFTVRVKDILKDAPDLIERYLNIVLGDTS